MAYQMTRSTSGVGNSQAGNHRNRCRRSLSLPLVPLAIPLYTPPPSRQDVQEGGQILFQNFVREEIQLHPEIPSQNTPLIEQLLSEAPQDYADSSAEYGDGTPRYRGPEAFAGLQYPGTSTRDSGTPEGYKGLYWSKMGRNLREMADSFANSKEGQAVKRQAEKVDLSEINEEMFLKLLIELFRNGVSIERVIALFYFCSTLIIRAASSGKGSDVVRLLFIWSLRFIKDKVCDWVYRHGGWETVLSKVSKVILTLAGLTLMCTIIGCGIVYIRKNW